MSISYIIRVSNSLNLGQTQYLGLDFQIISADDKKLEMYLHNDMDLVL